jgi:hypothetical protein
MVQVSSNGKMVKFMKVNSENLCLMVKARSYILMVKSLKANGRKIIINLFQQLEFELNF